jgi:hypothetical protein
MKNNDTAVRKQLGKILALRRKYVGAKAEIAAIDNQGQKEMRILEKLIAGKPAR